MGIFNDAMMVLGYAVTTLALVGAGALAAYRIGSWWFDRRRERSFQVECRVLADLGDPQKAGALIAALRESGGTR
jgi:uncharacterized membrane protein YhfC